MYIQNIFQNGVRIIQTHSCRLPWMEALLFNESIPLCKGTYFLADSVRSAINTWNDKNFDEFDNCLEIPKCTRSVYDLQITKVQTKVHGSSIVNIHLARPDVQVIEDSLAYEFFSFLGEFGGTIGMFLGFSFFSIFDLLEFLIQ